MHYCHRILWSASPPCRISLSVLASGGSTRRHTGPVQPQGFERRSLESSAQCVHGRLEVLPDVAVRAAEGACHPHRGVAAEDVGGHAPVAPLVRESGRDCGAGQLSMSCLLLPRPRASRMLLLLDPLPIHKQSSRRISTTSVGKFGERRKTGPHRFRRFLENSDKSAKFRKIRPKHTGDNGGTVKTGKTKIRSVSLINWPGFFENQRGDFRANFAKKSGDFFRKSVNGKTD
jgi:hypothetical protein